MEALENVQSYYCFYFRMNVKVAQVLQYNQNQDKYELPSTLKRKHFMIESL